MKFLKVILLTLCISFVPFEKSEAAVGAVAALAGSAAAGNIALTGLGAAGAGLMLTMTSGSCDGGGCVVFLALGVFVGAILLDDNSSQLTFQELELDRATELDLKREEIALYNAEIEEVNLVFSEVTSELNVNSTQEDAKRAWNNYQDMLSVETLNVMKKIVSQE